MFNALTFTDLIFLHVADQTMEVQISPVYSNTAQSLLVKPNKQQINNCNVDVTERKRFKSDLTFHCILCSDVYDDPNVLYEHMKIRHPQLYERDELNDMIEEEEEEEKSDDSDEEYEYNVSLMEPICELKQDDDVESNAVTERSNDEVDDDDDDDDNSTGTGTSGVLLRLPQGPGRGRRRDIDNERLESTQQVGTCFFQCTQCEKSFKFSGDLAKHVRSHTLNKPYQCSICEKTFTHIGSLNTHIRIHR